MKNNTRISTITEGKIEGKSRKEGQSKHILVYKKLC